MAIRRNRADRKMRGIPERRRRVALRVEPEVVEIPEWARKHAIAGLTTGEDFVWLRPGDARLLEQMDRRDGGEPVTIEVEFRYCKVCGRPLLMDDAASRRRLEEAGATSYMLPCGDECYEAQRDGRWRRLRRAG
jgi:hypothetical protein